ncbi:hypothetical protein M413DRAFT_446906 [Hebeloma cylindrosporum]|uniref:Uncharacterized protein n=1 Tax=Hebeloma cylindrosporum TaxID=76867 RepID=A0A0C2YFZ6_HEBCY|nr:hypothetical protein M413DRAFT_446906 [Hebeloma cylindrosporum h7]
MDERSEDRKQIEFSQTEVVSDTRVEPLSKKRGRILSRRLGALVRSALEHHSQKSEARCNSVSEFNVVRAA